MSSPDSLSVSEREAHWAPTGPCAIEPRTKVGEFCGVNGTYIETRDDVPLRPWFIWKYNPGDALGEPAFYYVGIQVVAFALCCTWFFHRKKCGQSKSKDSELFPMETPLLDKMEQEQTVDANIEMVGHRKHALGTATYYGILAWSALLMIAFGINLYGRYYDCQFVWPDAVCTFGDFRIMGTYVKTLSAHVYISWTFVLLFGIIIWMREKGSNLFYEECDLDSAEVVFVKKTGKQVVNKSTSTNEEPASFLKPFVRLYYSIFRTTEDTFVLHFENCEVCHRFNSDEKYIIFQCERYIWDGSRFALGQYILGKGDIDAFRTSGSCLSSDEIDDRKNLVGKNVIAYEVESYFSALIDEFMSFRYLYQLYMYSNWVFGNYWHVGGILWSIVVGSALIRVYIKRNAKQKIYNMTRLKSRTTVLRDDKSGEEEWAEIPSIDLVPGDIVKLTHGANDNWNIPADMILMRGNVICNESGLTGEPMPVNKKSLPQGSNLVNADARGTGLVSERNRRSSRRESIGRESFALQYLPPKVEEEPGAVTNKNRNVRRSSLQSIRLTEEEEAVKDDHFLFAGCKILEVGKVSKESLGSNNRDIDACLAMVSRTGISTVRGRMIQDILYPQAMTYQWDDDLGPVSIMLLVLGFLTGIFGVFFTVASGAEIPSPYNLYTIFLWCASQLFSPAIPLALVVGQISSAKRLISNCNIDVKDPNRIALGGKVKTVCFDKTGTITKDGLDYMGFVNTEYAMGKEKNLEWEVGKLSPAISKGLATCHNLAVFGSGVIGPQVEVEMFQATGFEMKVLDNVTFVEKRNEQKLKILEVFKFDHHTMTMSVVVEDLANKNKDVYVKGAPEKLLKLCLPETVPEHTEQQITKYALEGNYVLALATKPFNSAKKGKISRKAVEKDLTFLGLILFRNEMKPTSPGAFERLQHGGIECIMVTGDNAMCGSYIAKACGICDPAKDVLLGDVDALSGKVLWAPLPRNPSSSVVYSTDQIVQKILSDDGNLSSLALTGNAYNLLQDNERYMRPLMENVLVYARMSPDQKQRLVERIMDTGRVVGMVGDGGNDCGALRAAHVGLALTGSDASIVAPFTTTGKSLGAVVDLLLEGRCALANSFASYKFLIIYGQLFCVVKLVGYVYGTFMCTLGYLTVDVIFVIGVTTLMTYAQPKKVFALTTPAASLLSPGTVWSILQFNAVSLLAAMVGLFALVCDRGYIAHPVKYTVVWKEWTKTDSYEGGLLFIFFCIRIYGAAIAYSAGGKYRASILKNRALLLFIFANFACLTYLVFAPSGLITKWFHMPNENFNRQYTDRTTWIKYQSGFERDDGTVLPRNEPTAEGISPITLSFVYLVMVGSSASSIWLETTPYSSKVRCAKKCCSQNESHVLC